MSSAAWKRATRSSMPGVIWNAGAGLWEVTLHVPGRTKVLQCTFRPAAAKPSPEQVECARHRAEAWRWKKELYAVCADGTPAVHVETSPAKGQRRGRDAAKGELKKEVKLEAKREVKRELVGQKGGAASKDKEAEPGTYVGCPAKRRRTLHNVKPEPRDDSTSASTTLDAKVKRELPDHASGAPQEIDALRREGKLAIVSATTLDAKVKRELPDHASGAPQEKKAATPKAKREALARSLHTYDREKPNGRSPNEEEGFKFAYKFGGTLGGSEIFVGRGQHVEDEGMAVEPILGDLSKCRVLKRASRSSGVRGLLWIETGGYWKIEKTIKQATTSSKTKIQQYFRAQSYMTECQSYEEAVEAALQAALARRQELVEEGVLFEGNRKAIYQSEVPGVAWELKKGRWRANLYFSGKSTCQSFKAKDQTPTEIERARLLAEAARRDLEREAGFKGTVVAVTRARAPEEWLKMKVDDKHVCWRGRDQVFLVQVKLRERIVSKSIRPKSVVHEEIERARLQAVRVRDALLQVQQLASGDHQLDVSEMIAAALTTP
eukprot:CAMPEP_0183601308 /NCGR_PEP_ID=MMETSP0371-20130417/180376_1 /TAXON_ID=268820 /ORGANISM="Peridinium aciculiferum, Strain PAER-2" /LENGTH=548 /DNA_ID=CAMNT_0025813395 /DNA_START=163 /DNA_END=1809 /DNA_ORIENTATION=+